MGPTAPSLPAPPTLETYQRRAVAHALPKAAAVVAGYWFVCVLFGLTTWSCVLPHLGLSVIAGLLISGGLGLIGERERLIAEGNGYREAMQKYGGTLQEYGVAVRTYEAEMVRSAVRQRAVGMPVLLGALERFWSASDAALSHRLATKSHPALKAAETVRQETARRRTAEKEARAARALVEYYEQLAPFLEDYKVELGPEDSGVMGSDDEYSEDERSDGTSRYMSAAEYRRLSSVARNQLALDRYWTRGHSDVELGRMYERYTGYQYESEGYRVTYTGIFSGLEDLGRDLICQRNDEVLIVQCKHWSRHRVIREKHLFQLYGSIILYKLDNPRARVTGVFVTSTQLSDVARRVAGALGIRVREGTAMDRTYPAIKCNINRATGERIYHMPFDQQYDKVVIEPLRGERYARTAEEAERLGFRRAYRFRGGAQ